MEFFATSNSIPIHISDNNRGDKVIILLHGYLETLYIWEDFLPILSKDIRVISIDLPGHGLSGSFEVNTVSLIAGVIKDVMDICKVEKAYVLGHSMGGYMAINFAKEYRDRCEGIILLNSNPFADSPEKSIDRKREIELIRADKLIHLAEYSIPRMYAPSNLRNLDEKIQETIEICEAHDPEGIISSIKGLIERPDMQNFLKDYSDPLMMIFGDTDKSMDLDLANKLKQDYPQSESYIIQNSGHLSFIEQPKITANIINKFIEQN